MGCRRPRPPIDHGSPEPRWPDEGRRDPARADPRPAASPNGGVLKTHSRVFQEVLHRVLECGEFEKGYITFHDLRHTFASHWMMNGGDLFKLQRILGHKSADMTQRYAHLAPDAFQGDLGRFNKLAVPEASPVAELGVIRFAGGAR
ncbi:MAG: tyrosine-type recombinase/integrase [Deltaproteobacteria bacterium]|nr:tyrosine-type recombinase/integrase [Deltaproteobacteria bacterium]